ncbi:MAG: hypothetical protein Kow00127_11340 [Bacteroidales bacterium]
MKKLFSFLSLALIISYSGFSQSLVLIHDGTPLEPEATITTTGSVSQEMVVECDVQNVSSNTLDVLLTRYELSMVPGTQSAICWGGLCYPPTVSTSPSPTTIGPGQTAVNEFQVHYYPDGNPGVSTIAYTLFDAANTDDSTYVTVIWDGVLTSISTHSPNHNTLYPNPATDQVNIKLENENSANRYEIISLTGSKVMEGMLNRTESTVNTSALSEGIYLFRIKNDTGIISEEKLLIQR